MFTPTPPNASKDGQGAADNDKPFFWGAPQYQLTTRQLSRLLLMRGDVMDARRGENAEVYQDLDSGPFVAREEHA